MIKKDLTKKFAPLFYVISFKNQCFLQLLSFFDLKDEKNGEVLIDDEVNAQENQLKMDIYISNLCKKSNELEKLISTKTLEELENFDITDDKYWV